MSHTRRFYISLVAMLALSALLFAPPIDFAPHDLTTDTSHPPYVASAGLSFYAPYRAFDGGSDYWLGAGGAGDELELDLDSGSGAEFTPHDLTSNTSHSPIVLTASTEYSPGYAAWKTLDGAPTAGNWLATAAPATLEYDFGAGNTYTMLGYEVRAPDMAVRAPKDWTMEGSNDEIAWATIDTVVSQTGWTVFSSRRYSCDVTTTAYRYFRFNIADNVGGDVYIGIAEVSFFQAATSTANRKTMGSYAIQVSSATNRFPVDWTIEGANSGAWNVLGTVSGETWNPNETHTFTASVATTAYQFFRLHILATSGDTAVAVQELYLYEASGSTPRRRLATVVK